LIDTDLRETNNERGLCGGKFGGGSRPAASVSGAFCGWRSRPQNGKRQLPGAVNDECETELSPG